MRDRESGRKRAGEGDRGGAGDSWREKARDRAERESVGEQRES